MVSAAKGLNPISCVASNGGHFKPDGGISYFFFDQSGLFGTERKGLLQVGQFDQGHLYMQPFIACHTVMELRLADYIQCTHQIGGTDRLGRLCILCLEVLDGVQ